MKRATTLTASEPARKAAPQDDGDGFEDIVAALSTRLANASPRDIAEEVESTLRRLVEVLDYDRCTYAVFGPDGTLNVVHSAARDGIPANPVGPFGRDLRWYIGELRAGRVVALPDLPEGLPPEAAEEAAFARATGLRSNLTIPLRIGGRVAGVLAFAAVRRSRTWSDGVIRRLTLIGQLVAGASERARLEEETERLRNRLWHADRVARTGALTSAIAHEINQPLAAILGNAQAGLAHLDRGNASPAELRAILEAVVREDKRAAATIGSIRALLRQDDSDRARMDLGAAVAEILHLLDSDLRRQGVRVRTSLRAGCFVVANRVQVEQVVLNLVLNAAEAMQAMPRNVRELRVGVFPAEGGQAAIAVEDSGPGIASANRTAIFEPFWTTRPNGLGLGLAICRSIAEAHGGTIEVEANDQGGTTFVVTLPAADVAPATEDARHPERASATGIAEGGPVVCLVDDDAAVREGLVRLLEACGCAALAFSSGPELLARWPIPNAGCLLLDLRLPGMSGLEIQRRLAALGRTPPVVFMTGHGDVASSVEAMKAGAVDFLAKPVEQEVLVAVIRKALSLGAAERKLNAERERCRDLVARLSPRERDVAVQVIRGRLNKQIAADLGISEQTVKQHRGRVMEKLEVRSVARLVRVWELAESGDPDQGKRET